MLLKTSWIRKALALLLLLFLLSCSRDHHEVVSFDKELFSFSIPDSINPYLPKTISGEVDETEIRLSLPGLTNQKKLIATFEFEGEKVVIGGVPQESGVTENDFSQGLTYTLMAEDGSSKDYTISTELIPEIPHLYINTDQEEEITSKDDYVWANLRVDGNETYQDFEGRTKIRGRGNTTWSYPKKPYKLKLDSKASLFGLAPAKTWILLAEYLEGSMLYNAVPFKMGEMLGIPYTNHIIPTQVTLNGEYQGFYAFTEHKEVKKGRIDIGDNGWLIELDSHYDEPLQFKSKQYDLPVMLKYPKAKDMTPEEGEAILAVVQEDFEKLEDLLVDESFPNNGYLGYLDDLAFVNFMLVNEFTKNGELSHPKSVYINKKKEGKYEMGILWDFDWGFGYGGIGHYRPSTAMGSTIYGNDPGAQFFTRVMEAPYLRALFRIRWAWFKDNYYEELKDYIKAYAKQVEQAYNQDHDIWGKRGSAGDLEQDLDRMLDWLDARVAYMDDLYLD